MTRASFALALIAIGCGSRTGLLAADALHDAATEPSVDASPVDDAGIDAPQDAAPIVDAAEDPVFDSKCVTDAGLPGPAACKATLHVKAVQKSVASCFVDVIVAEGDTASLVWDCTPSGNARVFANGKEFVGMYDGKQLDVCTGTSFPWNDGCTWQSAQHISGDPWSGALTFTYTEEAVAGTNCFPPCTAFAVVTLLP